MARVSELSAVLAKIDADIARLTDLRAYLTAARQEPPVATAGAASAPKKRGRKPKKPAEPEM